MDFKLFPYKKASPLRILYLVAIIIFCILNIPFFRFYFLYIGLRWLYIFLFSISLSYLLTPLMRLLAMKFNILDNPDRRKIHESSTPLLGGVTIIVAFTSSLIANMLLERGLVVLLLGGIIVAFVSFLDDLKGIPATVKLFVQVSVVLILIHLAQHGDFG